MREIQFSADVLVSALLDLPAERNVCLLDSCGVSHLGSHLLMAGFDPIEILETSNADTEKTLELLNEKLSRENLAGILTVSYEFGLKLNRIAPRKKEFPAFDEPDVFLALFDCLIVHDYEKNKTFLTGNKHRFDEIGEILSNSPVVFDAASSPGSKINSNFTRQSYISAVKQIQTRIGGGDTYQTNLTRQIRARLSADLTPERIFFNLRRNHPAPFASFIRRKTDAVVSASPERFFKVQSPKSKVRNRIISASPVKGTRPRGTNEKEDLLLRNGLLKSEKDRAENVMIVDLLRNDIGRICEFGSVEVKKLCDLETHPTLFHLVSTIDGELRENVNLSDVLKAVFPCGSITGAPKISTMRIIDEIETAPRGLSMGAVGYVGFDKTIDFNVAIRTMVVRGGEAIFNVGGGIVIDSVPELEYEETIVKARALLRAIGASERDLIGE